MAYLYQVHTRVSMTRVTRLLLCRMEDPMDVVHIFALMCGFLLTTVLWALGHHAAEELWSRLFGDHEDDSQLARATAAGFAETDKHIKKLRRQIKALERALDDFSERVEAMEADRE